VVAQGLSIYFCFRKNILIPPNYLPQIRSRNFFGMPNPNQRGVSRSSRRNAGWNCGERGSVVLAADGICRGEVEKTCERFQQASGGELQRTAKKIVRVVPGRPRTGGLDVKFWRSRRFGPKHRALALDKTYPQVDGGQTSPRFTRESAKEKNLNLNKTHWRAGNLTK